MGHDVDEVVDVDYHASAAVFDIMDDMASAAARPTTRERCTVMSWR